MNERASVSIDSMRMDIMSRAEVIHRRTITFEVKHNSRTAKYFGWVPPTWPAFKLNTDGVRKYSGVSSAGGLIRNTVGEWIEGFSINIGICSITIAELWVFIRALLWLGISVLGCFKLKLTACVLFNYCRPKMLS